MKTYNSSQLFDYPWEYVTAANWRKYPNEMSTHVVGVDILRQEYIPDRDVLVTERLITCKQPIPSWLSYIVGSADTSYVREVSVIDRNEKTLIMRSVNLTMQNLLKVRETVTYSPDLSNPNSKTKFNQVAEITSGYGWSGVRGKIEDWAVERFGQNASKGKLGFESVLQLGLALSEVSGAFDKITDKATQLIDNVNVMTLKFVKELEDKSEDIKSTLSEDTTKILKEISQCNVFRDANSISFDLLNEINHKTNQSLRDLNEKTREIMEEVNSLTHSWLENENIENSNDEKITSKTINEVNIKTRQIVEELNGKTSLILREMNQTTNKVFKALDEKTNELFLSNSDLIANSPLEPSVGFVEQMKSMALQFWNGN